MSSGRFHKHQTGTLKGWRDECTDQQICIHTSDCVRARVNSHMQEPQTQLQPVFQSLRTLLGAPGIATRNKKLLGAKGIATNGARTLLVYTRDPRPDAQSKSHQFSSFPCLVRDNMLQYCSTISKELCCDKVPFQIFQIDFFEKKLRRTVT